jgi:hypothetical protein
VRGHLNGEKVQGATLGPPSDQALPHRVSQHSDNADAACFLSLSTASVPTMRKQPVFCPLGTVCPISMQPAGLMFQLMFNIVMGGLTLLEDIQHARRLSMCAR